MPGTREGTRLNLLEAGQVLVARKGFGSVGLAEILATARVPKGSFYHFFPSKDAFGEALLINYFTEYLREMDEIFTSANYSAAEQLTEFWRSWERNETEDDFRHKCLAVKLGTEVADLSAQLRGAYRSGITSIIDRLSHQLARALEDGSLTFSGDASTIARSLFDLWMGASVRARIEQNASPFIDARAAGDAMVAG